jgi:hypothetical protein
MMRSTAWCLVVALLLGSGRLLACDWECGDAVTARDEVACHESSESGASLLGGVTHACPSEAIEPVVTATHKAQKQTLGASQAPSQTISSASPSIGRRASRPSDLRAAVPHPFLIGVLRI